jgi:cell division transport system permease protein
MFHFLKDRDLGVAYKRRYDLGLEQSGGAGFLSLLVGLMTFLTIMFLAAYFALGNLSARWSSGLENKITIEIPLNKADKSLRNEIELRNLTEKVKTKLERQDYIQSVTVLSTDELQDLITPWFSDSLSFGAMPMPRLISVNLHSSKADEANVELPKLLKKIDPTVRFDGHDEWLSNILKLADTLGFFMIFLGLIISITTCIAIAGAVKSRIAVHHADVELLHLIGAQDGYIARQFQKYALRLSLKGSLIGFACGICGIIILMLLTKTKSNAALPEFDISTEDLMTLLLLPIIFATLSVVTARFTVLKELKQMT